MEPTQQDAEAMLRGAGEVETAVRAGAPQELPLYVGMGITILFLGMAVDLSEAGELAGVVAAALVLIAFAVTVCTNLSYLRRYRQVRTRSTPKWVEWALGLWSAVAVLGLGFLLDGTIGLSFTLGGLLGAVPFMLWAERLRRTT
jgi:membrane associated rhomboid family serine protease